MRSLIVVALLGLLGFTTGQMTYYFTASSYVKSSSTYQVEVNIHRPLPEPVDIHVMIKQNNSYMQRVDSPNYVDDRIVAEDTFVMSEQGSSVIQLKVPSLSIEGVSSWSIGTWLEINCTGGIVSYYSERLNVQSDGLSVYVQSDKAMYKPSDLIRFRTFATDSDLKPFFGKFNISIIDPDRNILKMWRNQQSESGVISLTFQLSDQPPLGNWEIKVKLETGEEKTYRVQVKEYVLPKFKVSVEMPPFILDVSDKFRAIVEAKYTFGKPVKGNASIAIGIAADGYRCRDPWQEDRYTRREVHVCKRHRIFTELNEEGKYDIDIDVEDIMNLLPYTICDYRGNECNLTRKHLNYQRFFVWVNVTETATGIMLSGQEEISFSGNPVNLDFLPATPSNYKPGLPFIGYIQLTQPDGTPIPEPDLMKADGTRRSVNLTVEFKCPFIRPPYPGIRSESGPVGPPRPIPDGTPRALKEATTESPEDIMTGTTAQTTETTTPACVSITDSKMLEVSPGGIMGFEVPVVPGEFERIILSAKFTSKYESLATSNRYISPFETKSNKGLRVLTEMEDGALKPGSTAFFEVTAGEEISSLRYDIIAKGSIVHSAEKVYDTLAMTQNFSLMITEDFARELAPSPRIIVWYVSQEGEIIADSISFNVDSELANQVKIKFSTNQTKPGTDMNLMIEAYKGSTVGVLVVDQSVKLLASGNDITKEMIEGNLRGYNPNTPYYPALFARGGRWGGFCCGCWPFPMSGGDTSELFQTSGYILFTDALVYKKPEPTYGGRRYHGPAPMAILSGAMPDLMPQATGLQPVERVRNEFPETWIWLNTIVGPDGRLVHHAQAPDTITSWVASAFALSKDKGLGVSSPAEMTVFKPFFVSLTLPFALIRGEEFGLKCTVFNYLSNAQDVTVTLDKSIYYDVLVAGQEVSRTARQTVQVPANDAQTVVFWIIPTKVGQMNITVRAQSSQAADALRRIIPVRPEGTPQEHTESMLISMAQRSSPFVKVLKPNFPPKDMVEDSQRVKVTVIGDIMGPMVNNLGSFVKMPYGCGEQNMVNFVPNIQVLRYLDAANLNMPEIRDAAIRYMESGYQRELTYKRVDGSFSAFGDRDQFGSTWLTAFVLKSFAQAVPYMEVNEKHIEDAIKFLVRMQSRDGSFTQPGKTASYLAGGSGTHANMAAYIAIALTTARDANYTDVAFRNKLKKILEVPLALAVQFLESNMTGIETDPYSMAITAYAFTIIGNRQAEAALDKMNSMGYEKNGMKYWANKPEEDEDINRPWWYYSGRTRSYDIEMTSYAMLTNLYFAAPDKSLPTLKWLTKKRNAYGGYYSTQDTVMALQALTEFATHALGTTGKQKMYVRVSADINDLEFDPITPENTMVTQVREIPQHVNSLTVMGTGSGAAMVQMIINYNIRDPDVSEDLEVKVDSMEEEISGKVMVDVCFTWLKKGEESGMGILEITPLSGYEIDTETLLQDYKQIKRQERNGQTLVTYWDKFEEKETCLNVTLFKTVDVANIQEAEVKLYSYYQPEKSQTLLYLPQNLKSVNPCIACPACCQKDGIQVLEKVPFDENTDKEETGPTYVDRGNNQNNVNNGNKDGRNSVQGNGNGAAVTAPSIFVAAVMAIFAML